MAATARSQQPNDPILHSTEAAQLLGVSTMTLRRWAAAGTIDHERAANGSYLYRRSAIERMASERKAAKKAPAR